MLKKISCYVEVSQSIFQKTQRREIRFCARIIIILYLKILHASESKMRYDKNITSLIKLRRLISMFAFILIVSIRVFIIINYIKNLARYLLKICNCSKQ